MKHRTNSIAIAARPLIFTQLNVTSRHSNQWNYCMWSSDGRNWWTEAEGNPRAVEFGKKRGVGWEWCCMYTWWAVEARQRGTGLASKPSIRSWGQQGFAAQSDAALSGQTLEFNNLSAGPADGEILYRKISRKSQRPSQLDSILLYYLPKLDSPCYGSSTTAAGCFLATSVTSVAMPHGANASRFFFPPKWFSTGRLGPSPSDRLHSAWRRCLLHRKMQLRTWQTLDSLWCARDVMQVDGTLPHVSRGRWGPTA